GRAARLRDGTHDVQRLIAIEWGYLDRNDIWNFSKPTPELETQHAAPNSRLKIEAHQRDFVCHCPAVFQQSFVVGRFHCTKQEQTEVVADVSCQHCLTCGLLCRAADAGDANCRTTGGSIATGNRFGG